MRFEGRPWNGKRYVLEYGMDLLRINFLTDRTKDVITRTLRAYNSYKMNEIEAIRTMTEYVDAEED